MNRCFLTALAMVLCATAYPMVVAHAQSLRGSATSVDRMYFHAVDHGMYFYKTGDGLRKAAKEGRFVRLRTGRNFRVAGASYPYVRPATRTFLDRLGQQYRQRCGERMVVTSAARPKAMRLANSVSKSVHPTGMAIDLRKPTRRSCREWLRETLLSLERRGVLEATEEFRPPHFHVAVFPAPYTRYVQRSGDGAPAYAASGDRGTRYRVRRGDSLWGIARRHDTSVQRLKSANGLRSSMVRPGQTLVIPN